MTDTHTDPAGAPEPRGRKHIGVDISWELYRALEAMAKRDGTPLTIQYRWALEGHVAADRAAQTTP